MKNIITKTLITLFFINFSFFVVNAQISINEDGSNPDSSAILDVSSSDKGMLIPRMSSTARQAITNPATGLMVYDISTNSFWYFTTNWVEINTDNLTKLEDADGDTKIQVEESNDEDIIRFDIGGSEHFRLARGRLDFINSGLSTHIGEQAGQKDDFTNNENTYIGHSAGRFNETAVGNVAIGRESQRDHISGIFSTSIGNYSMQLHQTGAHNVAIGGYALSDNIDGVDNTAIGTCALTYDTTGSNNVAIGTFALYNSKNVSNNVVIGKRSGFNATGSGNVFIGHNSGRNATTSNTLYIENSSSDSPLIYGDFAADSLQINGKLNINGAYNFPISDGLANQILTTDGNGTVNWAAEVGAFTSENDLTKSVNNNDNFIFGSDTFNQGGSKFYFHKATASFRVGDIDNDNWDTDSLGYASFAGGYNSKAIGYNSFSFGSFANANGSNAVAIGDNNTASSTSSTSFGANTISSGRYSLTAGFYSKAEGDYAVALGNNAIASGNNATASGLDTKAEGHHSTAFGRSSIAAGNSATAFGRSTTANADYSTAIGYNTNAYSYGEIAIGLFNTIYTAIDTNSYNANDRLFVIGNGTNTSNRSDAIVVYKNGKTAINGNLTINDAYTLPTTAGTANQVLTTAGNGVVSWADDIDYDNQELSISNDILSITSGFNLIDLSSYKQELTLSNDVLSISGGTNTINLSGYSNTDNQELSLSNDVLSISGGTNTIDLSNYENTDDQKVNKLHLNGSTLELSLENDGENDYTVDLSSLEVPVGTIQMWPTNTPPAGWLICDGSTFNASTYSELNTILGGNTLPNFSGRFPLGVGNSGTSGSTTHNLTNTGGEEKHSLTIGKMPSHSHGSGTLATSQPYLSQVGSGTQAKRDGGDDKLYEYSSITGNTASVGGNQAHNNMPPFYTINFIIKAQ